ncbi:glyoxalase [Actinospica sp. MGRD01-02]|uniref:Glyoxalase n=1 Tax=Actinospica acidithermotolerans TaxID=2828514 RepID=A0A941IJL6_9ACTN|nr:glyoxalase [Actinospica acidithermotolerans]MBR7829604.1 glyoxalase [Actinospica acidithermotolerans]
MTADFSFEQVDHVQLAIPAGGEVACRVFWGGLLGLAEVPKPPVLAPRGGCWFDGPGFQVHLGVEAGFRPARKAHPGFRIRGIRALADRLASAGYPVTWSDEVPGQDRFHTADPFGNRLEFLAPH